MNSGSGTARAADLILLPARGEGDRARKGVVEGAAPRLPSERPTPFVLAAPSVTGAESRPRHLPISRDGEESGGAPLAG
jgi:hypothetical protein